MRILRQQGGDAVARLPGVVEVGASFTAGSMTVTHSGVANQAIRKAVSNVGYTAALADAPAELDVHDHLVPSDAPWWRTRKALLTGGCGLALVLAYLVGQMQHAIGHWVFLLALLVGLVPIGWRAISGALHGTPFSIETLMTIAAIGAVVIGATEEAATVMLLFLVGELLEGVAASRARAGIRGLVNLVPKTALVDRNGTVVEVPAAKLQIGELLLVRPGDRVAADGLITDGTSSINEAPVTGESIPKRKGAGELVFAGTVNIDAVLRVRVTAAAQDNTIARVVRLVEEAQESKAPTERFIDRFSHFYTPGVLVMGAMVAVVPPVLFGAGWSEWVYKGLAVLLIGCPCALVISTPAAIAAGLAAGTRRGLLLKGGAVLESLRTITAVAFDKTGTLTAGKPVVTDIVAFGRSEINLLSMAAALESGSSHPLALAILAKARESKAPVPPAFGVKAIAGQGVGGNVGGTELLLLSPAATAAQTSFSDELTARITGFNDEGKTVSVLLANGAIAGLFAMRDEPRPDAVAGLRALAEQGIETVMLTGDNHRTAAAIGSALGITVRAELLPEDKQSIVREMQSRGHVVAKVGDGINDAPALAAANIGIAMGGGTDVALETADAAVLHGRVADIADMVALSQAAMGNIWQNIVIALGLKAVFLLTTIIGATGLWPAILADTGQPCW